MDASSTSRRILEARNMGSVAGIVEVVRRRPMPASPLFCCLIRTLEFTFSALSNRLDYSCDLYGEVIAKQNVGVAIVD